MNARRCVSVLVGGLLLAGFLLAAGVPGALLLGVAPVIVCAAMHMTMHHSEPGGEIAQRAVRPRRSNPMAPLPRPVASATILPGSITK